MGNKQTIAQRRKGDQVNLRLSPLGVASRIVGDAGLTIFSVTLVLIVRAIIGVDVTGSRVESFLDAMASSGLLLLVVLTTSVCVTNAALGVYSRQRTYPMRTKMVRLAQSVALAGAAAGVLFFLLPASLEVPIGAFVASWALAAVVLPLARWWSWAYRLDIKTIEYRQDIEARRAAAVEAAAGTTPRKSGTVLVIGGAGYIGSALLPRLLATHEKVRVLDVFMYGTETIAPYLEHPKLEIVDADYRKLDKLVSALQDVDTVVHLGGLVGDPACAWNEALTVEVNLTFTRVIAEIAKASGVKRFVFASTCSVYGASDEVLDEESLLNPVSLYARSKIGSERVLRRLMSPEFAVTILRFGTIYGISGRTRFDLVVNLLAAKAYVDGMITVFGGDQWRPFVHVDDAAKAVATVVGAQEALVAGRVFNVGSEEQNATLGDVGRIINNLVPRATYLDSGRDGDRRNYRVSFRRIRDELGFVPDWTLEAGIRQVLEALRKGEVSDYRDPKYSNVEFLKEMSGRSFLSTAVDDARELISAGDDEYRVPAREPVDDVVLDMDENRTPAPLQYTGHVPSIEAAGSTKLRN